MSSVREPKRAVVDLNLFISGLISRLGQPHRLINHLRRGTFTLLISPQLRDELEDVLQRPKFTVRFRVTAEDRTAFLALLDARAVSVTPESSLPMTVRDPKDEIVLATALGGHADFIVTGDAGLLVLNGDPAIVTLRVVTVREFLTLLEE